MGKTHGKNTAVSLGGADLSVYSNAVTWNETADSHDITTYGKNSHVFQGGLGNGTATIAGFYDDSNTVGPAAVIRPMKGTVVALVYRPEGTGSGKPQRTVNVLVTGYTETPPVADMVTFQVDLQMSDDIVTATQ